VRSKCTKRKAYRKIRKVEVRNSWQPLSSAACVSLLITPYLIHLAPRADGWVIRAFRRSRARKPGGPGTESQPQPRSGRGRTAEQDRIFIFGFGPAGQRAAEDLLALHQNQLVVVDINPDNTQIA